MMAWNYIGGGDQEKRKGSQRRQRQMDIMIACVLHASGR